MCNACVKNVHLNVHHFERVQACAPESRGEYYSNIDGVGGGCDCGRSVPRGACLVSASIVSILEPAPFAQRLRGTLEPGGVLPCDGVSQSAQPVVVALLARLFPGRTILAVTPGLKIQEAVFQDVQTWSRLLELTEVAGPHFFPDWEVLPHENKLPHADVISERLSALLRLSRTDLPRKPLLVASVAALCQRTFAPSDLAGRVKQVKRGDQINPLDLVEWLENEGYEPEAQVTQKGEIALRGGIVDVFPPTSPWPIRLEFFGDELESLRFFDPTTQLSKEEITSATIPPAGELGILRRTQQHIAAGNTQDLKPPGSLLDYLGANPVLVELEPDLIEEGVRLYQQQVPARDPLHLAYADWKERLIDAGGTVVKLAELAGSERQPDQAEAEDGEGHEEIILDAAPVFQGLEAFRPIAERAPEPQVAEVQRREFFAQLQRWLRQSYTVTMVCNNEGEQQRLAEIWREAGYGEANLPQPQFVTGALTRGFLCEEARWVVVTDAEVFGRYKVARPRRLKVAHAAATRSLLDIDFTELEEGDFVVHLQHGIGRYVGLQQMPLSSGRRQGAVIASEVAEECLVIEYGASQPDQPPPRLYVPITEAHLVSKYVGTGKIKPQLNTLGGTRWTKAKEQAAVAVRDLAGELLSIQAAREAQVGHAFGADTHWQTEFENSFLYEETIDQLKAIREMKVDLERPKPMDRLVCGDVGYGKTEVAIRAAFKAVMGGKQVAILVPTTVLAQQHYNTFRERMSDYPVRVDLLSRFRSRKEVLKVIADMAAGKVDIVIGTHRLVQPDIVFKDLGLVVIDEEQRFGVLHKERFKRLRRMVDVLTLSATPIPRTLYLALTGARDLSTIETPPQDRLPVETTVARFDERIIKDAIQREVNRQGQVFYLHNRVSTIDATAARIKDLVPQARVLVGHGQMDSDDLEEVMTKFVNAEADVLVCTTIIESGIDIPNANTIIIDRADRFGLSELYQLRGRVGRYKHQAYAYILLPRHGNLLTDVRKRISAIKQYSSLGSGFKIAMRDLEIRGAGNLLGPEQSGHITAVGFDLYCKLLQHSVAALKGEKIKTRVEVQVRLEFLPVNAVVSEEKGDAAANGAFIPAGYITDARQRIECYRKLAQANDRASITSLQAEIRDRFGPLPKPLDLLFMVNEIRVLASEKGVTIVETKEDRLMLTRNNDFITLGGKFPRMTKKEPAARLKEIRKLMMVL